MCIKRQGPPCGARGRSREGGATIAIEDSANGVASALAAGMRCVAIPEQANGADPRFDAATWRMDSLTDFAEALPMLRAEAEER